MVVCFVGRDLRMMRAVTPRRTLTSAPALVFFLSELLLLSVFVFLAVRDLPNQEEVVALGSDGQQCERSDQCTNGAHHAFLPCTNGFCSFCAEDEDCDGELASCEVTLGVCTVPTKYDPTWLAKLLLIFSAAIANSGGLAGGTLFVPILTLFLQLPTYRIAAISQVCAHRARPEQQNQKKR